jgi:hypothetical protein
MAVGGQRQAPPLYLKSHGNHCTRGLDGPQKGSGRVCRRENLFPPPGFKPQTVQPLKSHLPCQNKNVPLKGHIFKKLSPSISETTIKLYTTSCEELPTRLLILRLMF